MKATFAKALVAAACIATAGGEAMAETYLVGTSADYPPFEWVDGNGNLVGFDMDVMRAVAILEDYEAEIQDLGFDTLIPGLQSDRIDIAAGIQINEERRKIIDASEPYIEVLYGVAVHEDSTDNLFTVFQPGKSVGAQRGTAQAKWIAEKVRGQGVDVQLQLYDTNDLAVLDLANGRIDGYVANTIPMREFMKRYPIRMSGIIYDLRAHFAYLVKKGDPKGLLPRINGAIAKMEADGSWDNLVTAYFGGDLTRITDCYAEHGDLLNVDRDIKAYAEGMKVCMVPGE